MMIFTDGSALGNPGSTGSCVFIKKNSPESTEIKIAHAVTKMSTSYQGELQAIRIGTIYAKENINISTENLYIYLFTAKQQYKPSQSKTIKLPRHKYHRNKTKPHKYQPQDRINQICIPPSP